MMTMDKVIKIMVNRRYSLIRGIISEVDGIVLVIIRRNIVKERRIEI